jgi:hypothetical protein
VAAAAAGVAGVDVAVVGRHVAAVAAEPEVVAVRAQVAAVRARVVAVRAQVLVHHGEADRPMLLRGRRRCRGRVLRTFKDLVAAKLQIIGQRWVICPRRAVDPPRGREIGPQRATLQIGRIQALGPAVATLPPVRAWVISPAQATLPVVRMWVISLAQVLGQALVRVLSPDHDQQPAHDPRRAMCKTILICRTSVVGMWLATAHQAASAMWPRASVERWPAVRLPSF